jgi:hypothetical protein
MGDEVTEDALKKHRAAWTDEWLRRRKDRLRAGFRELTWIRDPSLLVGER